MWQVRHWCKRQELLTTLADEIAGMHDVLQASVAKLDLDNINAENKAFADGFDLVIDTSEDQRQKAAEALWRRGEEARGEAAVAVRWFEKAIAARGSELCADDQAGRDRVATMRRVLMEVRRDEGVRSIKDQANDKMSLGLLLAGKGQYDEAVKLYQEAVELYMQVHHQKLLHSAYVILPMRCSRRDFVFSLYVHVCWRRPIYYCNFGSRMIDFCQLLFTLPAVF